MIFLSLLYNLYNVYMKTPELIENTALKTLNSLLGGSVTVDNYYFQCNIACCCNGAFPWKNLITVSKDNFACTDETI